MLSVIKLQTSYQTTKFFTENVLAIDIKKTMIFMNKPVSLGVSILELSKIVMHELWYNYVKQNMVKK